MNLRSSRESWFGALLLSVVITAGFLAGDLSMAVVPAVEHGLAVTAQRAGWIVSANLFGGVVGALISATLLRTVAWRLVLVVTMIAMIAADLLSAQAHDFDALVLLRLGHGLVAGTLVGTGFALVSRTRTPDSGFGLIVALNFGISGVAVIVLLPVALHLGPSILFAVMAGGGALALLIVPFLDDYPALPVSAKRDAGPLRVGSRAVLLTLTAVFLYQAGTMAVWAYTVGIGIDAALEPDFIAAVLGPTMWLGVVGAFLVLVVGVHFGRSITFAIWMTLIIGLTAALKWSATPYVYALANLLAAIPQAMVIAYLFGMSAELDPNGRAASLTSAASKFGAASGPLLGGFVLNEGGYSDLISFSVVVYVLATVAMLVPAVGLDRGRAKASVREAVT